MGTGRSTLAKGIKNTTAKLKNTVKSILGKKLKPLYERVSIAKALKMVNPHFAESQLYKTNCALCTTAAALQFQGYDVEAMPRDTKWRGFDSIFDYAWTSENFKSPRSKSVNYSGVPWAENYTNTNRFTGTTAEQIADELSGQMKSWGAHSFAAMNVSWTGGGAHVVLVYQNAEHQTKIFDFQTHREYPTAQYWFDTHSSAKLETIGLYRLDNQKVRKNIPDIAKIVKKRNKE